MDEKIKVGIITTGTLLATEGLDYTLKAGVLGDKLIGLGLVGAGTVLVCAGLYTMIKQIMRDVINKVLMDIANGFEEPQECNPK